MLLYIIIGILVIVIAILVLKIISMSRSVDKITEDLSEILRSETNNQIRVNTSDKHIRGLAVRLNEELKSLRETEIKYSRGNNEIKTAVVNISHDLRTPLTAITGYLDLLESEPKSPDAARYLGIISERVETMKYLTEELFKYSVTASGEDDFNPEELVLNAELESAIAALYGSLVEKGITPEINITENKVIRNLDRKALQRTFANILSNALKYSKGDLKITMTDEGEITFANRAEDLTATDVGKLFNRFFTVESAHHSTGLGLSIAKLLTEKNGGSIEASMFGEDLVISLKF